MLEVTVLSTSPSKEENAKQLGAHHFVVTSDPEQLKAVKGSFDFILDTVSAEHDMNLYISLLKQMEFIYVLERPLNQCKLEYSHFWEEEKVLQALV